MHPSAEPKRPHIDRNKQSLTDSDWEELQEAFPKGVDTLIKPHIKFVVAAADATTWEWYSFTWQGIISRRAKELIWPYADRYLRAMEVRLNEKPYYYLRADRDNAFDVLDRDRSRIKYFPNDPSKIMRIYRYEFKEELIKDPLVFQIPERGGLFCTPTIRQMVLDAGLKGFEFYSMDREVLY